jgi:hypothetical protein
MLPIYAITIFLCLSSLVVGEAILRICGYPARTHLAAPVGFSALVVLASAVLWLPGHRTTAGVIIVLVTVGAAARLTRERRRPDITALITALLTLAAVSIPFAVNRHVGIFGVSIDDDFAAHFAWAGSLFKTTPGASIFPGYPLGPHMLAASLAGLFGTSVEPPFTAILLAVPVLVALTAQSVLRGMSTGARVIGGLVVGLPYLVAIHLGEGSFKELMMGLILIGVVLTMRQLALNADWNLRRAVAPGILLAAALLIYGRTGALWPVAAVGLWAAATLAQAKIMPSGTMIRSAAAFVGVTALCAFVGSVSEVGRLIHFSGGVPGGNVPTYTSPFEVLGVWFSGDFRTAPSDVFAAGLLIGIVIAIAIYAMGWWLRRRDLAIPMAAVGSLVIYIVVRGRTGPYLTSKALVMAAPPTMLGLVVPLLSAWRAEARRSLSRMAVAVAGIGFAAAALWSSGFALRYARVGSDEHANELNSIRAIVRGKPTLDLVPNSFAFWELRGAKLSSPTPYGSNSVIPFTLRKPLIPGGSVDVDSVSPSSLDSFRYLVTTTSQYASEMPANWRLTATSRNFELWKRAGATPSRDILPSEGAAPGAVLNCGTTEGRALSRSKGVAGVWATPPIGPSVGWQIGATVIPSTPEGFVGALSGSVLTQTLRLPLGRWEISLPYQSVADLYLIAGNLRAIIPSDLINYGAYWRVGDITSTGAPIGVTLRLQKMRFDAAEQPEAIGGLVAVRLPRIVEQVPLHRACGRYVDWYTQ